MEQILVIYHTNGTFEMMDAALVESVEMTNMVVDAQGNTRHDLAPMPDSYNLVVHLKQETAGIIRAHFPKVFINVKTYEIQTPATKRHLMFIDPDEDYKAFTWENWKGEVPQIGDVVINYPEGADESKSYRITNRWFCNRQPDQVRYNVKRMPQAND